MVQLEPLDIIIKSMNFSIPNNVGSHSPPTLTQYRASYFEICMLFYSLFPPTFHSLFKRFALQIINLILGATIPFLVVLLLIIFFWGGGERAS